MAFSCQEPEHGFTCYWKIRNFNITSTSLSCSYESQVFKVEMLKSSSWYLTLEHTCRDSLGLYLHKENENIGNSNIDIQMSILTSSGWRTRFCHFFKFKPGGGGKGTAVLVDWNRHFSRKNHVLNGCLTVSCHMSNGATSDRYEQCLLASEVTFLGSLSHSPALEFFDLVPKHLVNFPSFKVSKDYSEDYQDSYENSWIQNITTVLKEYGKTKSGMKQEATTKSTQTEDTGENYLFNVSGDLIKLYKDKIFQCVTLRTSSKDFSVYKALLCAKSPFFNSMFQGIMKENDSNIVDIDDVDSDTLCLLLQFFHLESIPIKDLEWDAVVKLYYAADKYQIEQLKKECCSFLKKNATDENVCDASILNDMHQDTEPEQTVHENIDEKNRATFNGNWCF